MTDSYVGREPFTEAARSRVTHSIVNGQTIINTAYSIGYVDVFKNGLLLTPSEYTATNGTSISLNVALTVPGDTLETIAYGTFLVS